MTMEQEIDFFTYDIDRIIKYGDIQDIKKIKYDDKQAKVIKSYIKLHIFTGLMFSGKTSKLIQQYELEKQNKESKVALISHIVDQRYSNQDYVFSHNGQKQRCKKAQDLFGLLPKFCDYQVILIDEAQFFEDLDIFVVCLFFRNPDIQIYISGLDMKVDNTEFESLKKVKKLTDDITYLNVKCQQNQCNDDAQYTVFIDQKLLNKLKQNDPKKLCCPSKEMIGHFDKYRVYCAKHHFDFKKKANII